MSPYNKQYNVPYILAKTDKSCETIHHTVEHTLYIKSNRQKLCHHTRTVGLPHHLQQQIEAV